jgi:hypothetical protein
MRVRYLNTDLLLESAEDLTPIAEAFGDDVVVLHNGRAKGNHLASFEIAGSHAGADEDVKYFVALIEALPPKARALWERCHSRKFDLGYRSGYDTPSYTTELRASTIQAMAPLNASLVITIYPRGDDDT